MFNFFKKEKVSDNDFEKYIERQVEQSREEARARAELYESQKRLCEIKEDILKNGTLEQKVELLASEHIQKMNEEMFAQRVQNANFNFIPGLSTQRVL